MWTGFPKCGACDLIIASEQGSCELKISKFGGLRAKILAKNGVVEGKISHFFSKGGLVNRDYCLKWDPCELRVAANGTLANYRRGAKRGSSGPLESKPYFFS